MPTDRLSERDFDRLLQRTLRSSSGPVPADFTPRILAQIRESQERKILARVVLAERLALAGCVALVAVAVLAPMLLPDTFAGVLQRMAGRVVGEIPLVPADAHAAAGQALHAFLGQWQLYTVFAGVLAFAAYSLVGLFLGDKSKPLLILDF
jgi:hypothetical protein